MKSTRWIEITPSEHAWEREALDYLKARLPDGEPFRAWSNFEFIAEDGSINEVDLLVVSLHKVYLVEIKSWSGSVSGDAGTWRREIDGKELLVDSPLLLANRKAKKLVGLLKAQKALARQRRPYVEAVVFLSRGGVRCRLDGRGPHGGVPPRAVRAGPLSGHPRRPSRRRGFRSAPAAAADRPVALPGLRACDGAGGDPSIATAAAGGGLRAAQAPAGDGRLPGLGSRARLGALVEAAGAHLSALGGLLRGDAHGAAACGGAGSTSCSTASSTRASCGWSCSRTRSKDRPWSSNTTRTPNAWTISSNAGKAAGWTSRPVSTCCASWRRR